MGPQHRGDWGGREAEGRERGGGGGGGVPEEKAHDAAESIGQAMPASSRLCLVRDGGPRKMRVRMPPLVKIWTFRTACHSGAARNSRAVGRELDHVVKGARVLKCNEPGLSCTRRGSNKLDMDMSWQCPALVPECAVHRMVCPFLFRAPNPQYSRHLSSCCPTTTGPTNWPPYLNSAGPRLQVSGFGV